MNLTQPTVVLQKLVLSLHYNMMLLLLIVCVFVWDLKAFSAQISYIAPQKKDNISCRGRRQHKYIMVWYGILGFNVPLDTV